MADVFISYSRTDADFVRRLDDALAKANRKAWIDWQDIPLTAEWLREIYAGIEEADNFVFVLSPESIASVSCQKEVAHASSNNKRIIPILRRAVPDSAVPETLGRLNWIYFRDTDEFDATLASLFEALDTDLEWKRAHSRRLVRAKEWERERRDKSFLLRGRDLREAEEWQAQTASKEPKPTPLHSEYILAGRQAETHRQRQQLGAVAVALVVAIGLAITAVIQRNSARREAAIATSRQLAVQSSSLVDTKPDLALLLAVEAEKSDDNFEARSALFTALQRRPKLKAFLRRVGSTSSGFHARRLSALALTRDGTMIAAGGLSDGRIGLWNAATLQLVATLEGHTAPVKSVAFSPDGKTLLSGGDDKLLIFWDVAGRRPAAKLTDHPGTITSVAVNKDGRIAASGDDKNNVILWDVSSRLKIGVIKSSNTRTITHLMFARDYDLITVGRRATEPENDEITEFWDVRTLQRRGNPIHQRILAFSQDFKKFAAVSKYEGTSPFSGIMIKIPALSAQSESATNQTRKTETEQSRQILVTVFDSDSGQGLGAERITDSGPVTGAAFSPDGLWLAFGDGSAIHLWDLNAGRLTDPLQAHQGIVDTVAFAPDGKTLASSGWDDAVILWDVSSQGYLNRKLNDNGGGLLAFSPDGKTLASATREGVVLWDVQTGKSVKHYESKFSNTTVFPTGSLAFNPQGTMLAFEGEAGAYLLSLSNTPPDVPSEILSQATAIAFHPTGGRVAFGLTNGEILLWDMSTHQANWRIPASSDGGRVTAITFNPSGNEVASGYSNGTIVFWDSSSGQAKSQDLRAFDASEEVPGTLAFSSDGQMLVATAHQSLSLWDVASRIRLNSLANQDLVGAPLIAAFSPDANIFVWSTLALHDVNVLDSRARQQFGPPLHYSTSQPDVYVDGLAFSPDGKTLATAYWRWVSSSKSWVQSGIFFWNFDPTVWKRQACATANRNLTREEWAQYLGPAPYRKSCPQLP